MPRSDGEKELIDKFWAEKLPRVAYEPATPAEAETAVADTMPVMEPDYSEQKPFGPEDGIDDDFDGDEDMQTYGDTAVWSDTEYYYEPDTAPDDEPRRSHSLRHFALASLAAGAVLGTAAYLAVDSQQEGSPSPLAQVSGRNSGRKAAAPKKIITLTKTVTVTTPETYTLTQRVHAAQTATAQNSQSETSTANTSQTTTKAGTANNGGAALPSKTTKATHEGGAPMHSPRTPAEAAIAKVMHELAPYNGPGKGRPAEGMAPGTSLGYGEGMGFGAHADATSGALVYSEKSTSTTYLPDNLDTSIKINGDWVKVSDFVADNKQYQYRLGGYIKQGDEVEVRANKRYPRGGKRYNIAPKPTKPSNQGN